MDATQDSKTACEVCKTAAATFRVEEYFAIVLNEDIVGVIRNPNSKLMKAANVLMNEDGGLVLIHASNLRYLDELTKVDENEKLPSLIPDDTLFHEWFDLLPYDKRHVILSVTKTEGGKPPSTIDFYSKISRNRGIYDPTHAQMRKLFSWVSHCTGKDGGCTFCKQDERTLSLSLSNGDDHPEVLLDEKPFCESYWLQAKDIPRKKKREDADAGNAKKQKKGKKANPRPTQKPQGAGKNGEPFETKETKEIAKHFWGKLGEVDQYISAFAKVPRGGFVVFGLSEEKTKDTDLNEVTALNEEKVKDTGLNEEKNNYIGSDEEKTKDKKKPYITTYRYYGFQLANDKRDQLKKELEKMGEELLWYGVRRPHKPFTVTFRDLLTEHQHTPETGLARETCDDPSPLDANCQSQTFPEPATSNNKSDPSMAQGNLSPAGFACSYDPQTAGGNCETRPPQLQPGSSPADNPSSTSPQTARGNPVTDTATDSAAAAKVASPTNGGKGQRAGSSQSCDSHQSEGSERNKQVTQSATTGLTHASQPALPRSATASPPAGGPSEKTGLKSGTPPAGVDKNTNPPSQSHDSQTHGQGASRHADYSVLAGADPGAGPQTANQQSSGNWIVQVKVNPYHGLCFYHPPLAFRFLGPQEQGTEVEEGAKDAPDNTEAKIHRPITQAEQKMEVSEGAQNQLATSEAKDDQPNNQPSQDQEMDVDAGPQDRLHTTVESSCDCEPTEAKVHWPDTVAGQKMKTTNKTERIGNMTLVQMGLEEWVMHFKKFERN